MNKDEYTFLQLLEDRKVFNSKESVFQFPESEVHLFDATAFRPKKHAEKCFDRKSFQYKSAYFGYDVYT